MEDSPCYLHFGKPEESLSSLSKTTHLVSDVEKSLNSQLQEGPFAPSSHHLSLTVALCLLVIYFSESFLGP